MSNKAQIKYIKANIKVLALKLNKNTEMALIEHLSKIDNKNGYIKGLIIADMRKQKPS